ncbi:MAG: ASKHA domain-containing protein [Cohaesibacter sp.]|nr:ASKHA domain-containing protein [Cohaesibacter sp.]
MVFQPSGKRGRFAHGTSVLDAARSLGVYIESVCGGRGICGRCQIEVSEGTFAKDGIRSTSDNLSAFGDLEARYSSKRFMKEGRRLSCTATVQGDLVVDVPQDVQINAQVVRKRAEKLTIKPNPATRLVCVGVEEPDMEKGESDANRLIRVLKLATGLDQITMDPSLFANLQTTLRKGKWQVTAAIYEDVTVPPTIVALWPGQKKRGYGLAVDIGSTTIAAHLCDLSNGRAVASSGTANPQIRFGEDLMSRVSYVQMNPGRLPDLVKSVRDALNVLIGKLAGQVGLTSEDILEMTIVANPVMHHIFLGIDPVELGGAPFALSLSDAQVIPARDIGMSLHPAGKVYVLPCIAGHVGADAAAVALAEEPYKSDETTLIIDVGTNAEILLGNKERLMAASSPTGPAFEGAEISCGQRAAPGAIERVRINRTTLEPRIKVIGVDHWSDEPEFAEEIDKVGVTGICGSGIVEIIAEMYLCGILSSDGVVQPHMAERSSRIEQDGRTYQYRLWDGTVPLTIKQTDVRAIQLAKAALYAGAKLLMEKMGVDKLDRIKLAGAFGSFIDPDYAMILGLIPDCSLDAVSGVGNAAGTGARKALVSRDARREIEQAVYDIEKIETAVEPRFQEHFVNAMAFPNKVDPYPLLRSQRELPAFVPATVEGSDKPRRRGGRRSRG